MTRFYFLLLITTDLLTFFKCKSMGTDLVPHALHSHLQILRNCIYKNCVINKSPTHSTTYPIRLNQLNLMTPTLVLCRPSAWVGFSVNCTCVFAHLFVHSITQERMTRKCSNLVQGMTLGYPGSETVLGLKGQGQCQVTYSNSAWVRTPRVPSSYNSKNIKKSLTNYHKHYR